MKFSEFRDDFLERMEHPDTSYQEYWIALYDAEKNRVCFVFPDAFSGFYKITRWVNHPNPHILLVRDRVWLMGRKTGVEIQHCKIPNDLDVRPIILDSYLSIALKS